MRIYAIHKYIKRKEKRIGYYSGYTLANRMELSSQVPFTEEIASIFAPAPVRKLTIKNRKYILRRPAVKIYKSIYEMGVEYVSS